MSESPREQGLDGTFLIEFYIQLRRRAALIVAAGLILLIAGALFAASRTEPAPAIDTSKLGMHFLFDDGREGWPVEIWDAHFARAAEVTAPGGIAVQLVRADDYDPERWQTFIDLSRQYDLHPVLRLATTWNDEAAYWNAPEPDTDGNYTTWGENAAAFVDALDWDTLPVQVILLNEPNNGVEWSGNPDPVAYARFAHDVSRVLRAEIPQIRIYNAALDLYAPQTDGAPFRGTNHASVDADTFLTAMHEASPDLLASFDAWNSHPYPLGPFREPPSEQARQFDRLNGERAPGTLSPDVFNRGVNGYEWELWKLEQLGIDALPVIITETGYRHAESTVPASADAGENYPDALAAARYWDLTLRGRRSPFASDAVTWVPLLADERVIAVAPFAFNGVPSAWGHTNWLELSPEGDILGTYPVFDTVSHYDLR